jgi:L-fuconolactonase
VDVTILVQAADTVAETEYLLGLAAEQDFVAGVVGWAPLDDPEGSEVVADLSGRQKLVGLRPMIQDQADDAWMLGAEVDIALSTMEHMELRLDALVRPQHLVHLRTLVGRHPDLPVVIDHCGKPAVREGTRWPGMKRWKEDMAALGAAEQVCCKLSGLLTEAGEGWTADQLRPFVDCVLETFGPSRTLWGSDWPVCLLAGSYQQWCAATDELLSGLTAAQRAEVLGGAAARFYGLEATS